MKPCLIHTDIFIDFLNPGNVTDSYKSCINFIVLEWNTHYCHEKVNTKIYVPPPDSSCFTTFPGSFFIYLFVNLFNQNKLGNIYTSWKISHWKCRSVFVTVDGCRFVTSHTIECFGLLGPPGLLWAPGPILLLGPPGSWAHLATGSTWFLGPPGYWVNLASGPTWLLRPPGFLGPPGSWTHRTFIHFFHRMSSSPRKDMNAIHWNIVVSSCWPSRRSHAVFNWDLSLKLRDGGWDD